MYDVAIIGAGVIGAMTARALSKYNIKVCVLEKENDVAMGASKANSGIVHAGFDAAEDSEKARFNVEGSKIMEQVCAELHVPYHRNGALVVGFSEQERQKIEQLYERGLHNGVEGLEILGKDELERLEPNISPDAICALYAPTSAIVCPYELTIAAMGNAMDNGVDLLCNFEVVSICRMDDCFAITGNRQTVKAKMIVNCAGLFADKIERMVGNHSFEIHPRKGEYILMDRSCGSQVSHTIFRTPTEKGKGILITPTVDGNLLVGPTSVDIDDKENKQTTADGLRRVMDEAKVTVPSIPFGETISSFCGLRAIGDTGDFIITVPTSGFVNVAGIESPGLTAAPALGMHVCRLLAEEGLCLMERENYCATRKSVHLFRDASLEEKNRIIAANPSYGHVICRCEGITEGEILDSLRRNPKATDLDGVKRRTRAQMGRCQGGFCTPQIIEIIKKESGVPFLKITKKGQGSHINIDKTK